MLKTVREQILHAAINEISIPPMKAAGIEKYHLLFLCSVSGKERNDQLDPNEIAHI